MIPTPILRVPWLPCSYLHPSECPHLVVVPTGPQQTPVVTCVPRANCRYPHCAKCAFNPDSESFRGDKHSPRS